MEWESDCVLRFSLVVQEDTAPCLNFQKKKYNETKNVYPVTQVWQQNAPARTLSLVSAHFNLKECLEDLH